MNIDLASQLRLAQLSATNLGSVMTQAQDSLAVRLMMIKNLEARAGDRLSTEERMWLAWCKGFK